MGPNEQFEMNGGEEERLQVLKRLRRNASAQMHILYQALGDESWRIRKEATEVFLSLPGVANLAGEVIELLHAEDNAGLRNAAVEILVSMGCQAVPALLDEISCSDHDVRKFILDILGEICDPSSVPAMIGALGDADENVRAAAAENLGKARALEAVPALLDALRNADLLFRFTILQALGQIGAKIPAERLLEFKDEPLLRKALFDCLGRVGGDDAVAVLVDGLMDRMRNVREAAVIALAHLGQTYPHETECAMASLLGGAAATNIAEFLRSTRADLRSSAVKLLGWLGDGRFAHQLLDSLDQEEFREETVAALVSIGRKDPDALIGIWPNTAGRTRAYLAYLLGAAECPGGVRLLHEGLTADDSELRLLSARGLAAIGDADSLPILVARLKDPESEVREEILAALERLGSRYQVQILEHLHPLLSEDDPEQRMHAVLILGSINVDLVQKSLLMALKDESSHVRQAALRALAIRPGVAQTSALVLALTDEDREVRRLAAELLGRTGDNNFLQPLALALQDEDPWVRATVVRSLAQLSGVECLESLLSALRDPVGLVVIAALETLAGIDGHRFLPQLLGALDHPDEEVVSASLQLLTEAGRLDWMASFRERLLNHRHWEVRSRFARILAAYARDHCRVHLEERLLLEGEDFVRQQLEELLAHLPPAQS